MAQRLLVSSWRNQKHETHDIVEFGRLFALSSFFPRQSANATFDLSCIFHTRTCFSQTYRLSFIWRPAIAKHIVYLSYEDLSYPNLSFIFHIRTCFTQIYRLSFIWGLALPTPIVYLSYEDLFYPNLLFIFHVFHEIGIYQSFFLVSLPFSTKDYRFFRLSSEFMHHLCLSRWAYANRCWGGGVAKSRCSMHFFFITKLQWLQGVWELEQNTTASLWELRTF